MKKIFSILIILAAVLISCMNTGDEIKNLLLGEDITWARILDYSLVDNSLFSIRFSEKVEINEIVFNGDKTKKTLLGDYIEIPLPRTLKMGEKFTIALTFSKNGGNTFRAWFTLYGKNDRKADLIITEASIAGTKVNPDRIELYVRKGGNTAGMMVTDALGTAGVILPGLEVNEDDIIVIYWDSKSRMEPSPQERYSELYTYYVDGGMDHTLISTTGVILLYDEVDGAVIDALPYSDFTEAAEKKTKFQEAVDYLISIGEWEGEAVYSGNVTSSRVLARFPTTEDTNSEGDWITTAAKGSTFGKPNYTSEYEEE